MAVEDLEKWRSGNRVVRMELSEDDIRESLNAAKAAKTYEIELYVKFLTLKGRFV